ncbi:MAG: hypothetical protein Roseis2KO_02530 [Roseivirga sp.]
MNTSIKQFIQGNWSQIKQKLKDKYKNLSEHDLRYNEGSERRLLERLQVKLNMEEKELLSELKRVITQ